MATNLEKILGISTELCKKHNSIATAYKNLADMP